MVVTDAAQEGNIMKPSEVIKLRDQLSEQMYEAFRDGGFRMHDDSQELADWLIGHGWVKEVPNEDVD
jgi:O-methyltransferase involved in polyketide biosynthesis